MLVTRNECRGCATDGYPCRGEYCGYRHVEVFVCDCCGCEEKLYYYEDKELCKWCLLEQFEEVEGSGDGV